MPIFQPSMMKSSSSSRALCGGDAGSQTLRCSATSNRCMRWRISTETCVMRHVRTTTTTTHTHNNQPQPQPHTTTQNHKPQTTKKNQQYNLGRLRFDRRGASTHSGELNHALPSRWPKPIPAIPPYVVRTPHLHGAPTTEETVKL